MPSRVVIDADVTAQFTACYLRVDGDEAAFIEAHTAHALPKLLSALAQARLAPEQVRWVVVTHAHLDHAAGAAALMQACPNATLLAHPRAARHLISPQKLIAGATAVYGEARFASLYGTIDPIAAERVKPLDDGAAFSLGSSSFTVMHTLGHANHHLVVDDPALDCVYTGDAFGLMYPAVGGGRLALPSTSPSNFDGVEAIASVRRVASLGRREACLTHFGPVSELRRVADQLEALLTKAADWVANAKPEATVQHFAPLWRTAIADAAKTQGVALTDADWRVLALDVELNAQGLVAAVQQRRA
jgi:glyoxylase-like metal-dependent hydrolase (beta-lactamase superfamily II)